MPAFNLRAIFLLVRQLFLVLDLRVEIWKGRFRTLINQIFVAIWFDSSIFLIQLLGSYTDWLFKSLLVGVSMLRLRLDRFCLMITDYSEANISLILNYK